MENSGLISPNLVTFLATIINIGILFFLLRLILFKPVTKFMEARTKKIQDTINQTEMDKNQAKQVLQQYEDHLKNAEAEADEIIRTARETAGAEAERIISEGSRSLELMQANARRQLQTEHEAALAKFRAEAVVLVMAACSALIGRDIQSDDNRRYVNMLMDELSSGRMGASRAVHKGDK